ncbi:MAG: class I SAM-dependent methyltransferase [Muribaculaceae bacterium]
MNNLSAINKSWLHITDNEHFIEKLDDITCPHTDFDPFGIVNLAETLNLSPFYLTEFSNATYDKTTTPLDNFQLFEDIKTYEEQQNNFTILEEGKEPFGTNSIEGTTDNNNFPNKSAQLAFETNEKIMPLKGYSEQIINAVWGNNEMKVNIMCYDNFCLAFPLLAPKINQEHLVIVEGDYTEEERLHLQRFLKKEVFIISEKMFGWQMGEYKGSTKNAMATVTPVQQVQITPLDFPIVYSLPQWVDDLIFDELKAEYAPDHIRFEYNLNLDSKEVLTYLGTYFPRSYAEVYHLFSKLLFAKEQKTFMGEKNTLNILDLGCGTGGEILGLLNYIEDYLTNIKVVQILAIDGNHYALRVLEKILKAYKLRTHLNIKYTIGPAFIESEEDLNLISEVVSDKYDIILSCKAICELASKKRLVSKPYKNTVLMLSKKLSTNGIMLIEDVTIKNNNEFIPVTLNKELNEFIKENPEFVTLLPTSCQRNGNKCLKGCFFKEEIKVNHSRKNNDISKIVFRFISHRQLLNIFENNKRSKQHTV